MDPRTSSWTICLCSTGPDITDVMDALRDDYLRYGPAINDLCCVRMASQVDEDEEYGVDWDEES